MSTKTYTFNLKFTVTLDDDGENTLPETLPDGLPDSIAKEFSSVEDYYDGFSDMIIEACGCDVKNFDVKVIDTECRCDSDEPCPIHY